MFERKKPRKHMAMEAVRPKSGAAVFFEYIFASFKKHADAASQKAHGALDRVSKLPLPKIPGGKRPILIVFDLFMGLATVAAVLYCLFVLRADTKMRQVTLNADGATAHFMARESTVSDFLSRSGITLSSYDELSEDPSALIKDGMEVNVIRAFPVAVESHSYVTILNMTDGTVGDALDIAGVKAGVEDELSNRPFEDIEPGMKIRHIDVEISYPYNEKDNLVPLYYREITIKDDTIYNYKDPVVVQEGRDGVKEVTRRVITKNGVVVSRTIVGQRVIEPAVDEVVRVGTKIHYQTKYEGEWRTFNRHNIVRPSDGVDGWKAITVHAITGYCTGTRTATGTRPKLGTIAVNPKLIPYYTKIYIPGYGYGTALDTGAFRNYSGEKSNAIDLWFNTRAEAVRWGRKYNRTIYIKVN